MLKTAASCLHAADLPPVSVWVCLYVYASVCVLAWVEGGWGGIKLACLSPEAELCHSSHGNVLLCAQEFSTRLLITLFSQSEPLEQDNTHPHLELN